MNHTFATKILGKHSKSFNAAAALLPRQARTDGAVLYAWCRRADDAIDLGDPSQARTQLAQLRRELDSVYASEPQSDETLSAFQGLVTRYGIDKAHPLALLQGFEMDLGTVRLKTLDELLLYSYRVAGVVGLMMCPILGITDVRASTHAVHLGIAMQLTNICRDVAEDWERDRLYLPEDLLQSAGIADLGDGLGAPLARAHGPAIARVIHGLLRIADGYYASGDAGLTYMSPRMAIAIRAARNFYWAIGRELERRNCNALEGRAVVSRGDKLRLALRAIVTELSQRVVGRPHGRNNEHAATALQLRVTTNAEGVIDGAFLLGF